MIRASKNSGFTIVELLIIIVVIGILAALVLNTFAGVQARARDNERQTDVRAIVSALETYYVDSGSYPRPGQLTQSDFSWVTPNLKGFDKAALFAPNETTISIVGVAPPNPSNVNRYGYFTYLADGTTSCTLITGCASYVISWRSEVTGSLNVTQSLNK